MARRSRKVKPGERSYLLTGIPEDLHDRVLAKAARLHTDECVDENRQGQLIAPERCKRHALKPVLLQLLQDWASS